MSEQVWLPLIRSSGPQTLGQAVLRLATLAEAAHRYQATEAFLSNSASDIRVDGSAPQDVAAALRGLDHTEVDR